MVVTYVFFCSRPLKGRLYFQPPWCLKKSILIGSGSFVLVPTNFIPLEFSDSVRFMVHACMLAMSDCDSIQSKGSGMIFKISGMRYIWACYVSFNHVTMLELILLPMHNGLQ